MKARTMRWALPLGLGAVVHASIAAGAPPKGSGAMECFGNEPDWRLTLDHRGVSLEARGKPARSITIDAVTSFAGMRRQDGRRVIRGRIGPGKHQASIYILEANDCSDSMSAYRYEQHVIVDIEGETPLIGCCGRKPLYKVKQLKSGDVLNVRSKPDSKSPIVETLRPGTGLIRVRQRYGNWALIELTDHALGHDLPVIGWVHSAFLDETKP